MDIWQKLRHCCKSTFHFLKSLLRYDSGAESVQKESGRHSYVSFAYSKGKGVYLTLYYAPKLEGEY